MSKPFRPKNCKIWYIRYQRDGERITESGTSSLTALKRVLSAFCP